MDNPKNASRNIESVNSNDLPAVLDALDDSSMSLIDFDQLKVQLSEMASRLDASEKLESELTLLRDDYEQRIAGMVKAITAVDRKRDRWEEAVAYIEDLTTFDGAKLVQEYRRVSARFRDSFPASFGLMNARGGTSVDRTRFGDYK